MLPTYVYCICNGIILLELVMTVCTLYAYLVDRIRPEGDPKKKDFHPAAILLAPFTWPLILLAVLVILLLKALIFGVFLIVFTLALLGIRKPFLLVWLDKFLRTVGDRLLEFNTLLIRAFLSSWSDQRQGA